MTLKIMSNEQLANIVYVSFKQYDECVISLTYHNDVMYFISSKLDEDKTLLSICVGAQSVGNIVSNDDDIWKWVREKCTMCNINNTTIDIEITVKGEKDTNCYDDIDELEENDESKESTLDGYYDIIDYRDEYLTHHNRMKLLQKPLSAHDTNEAIDFFLQFLYNESCNKIIFSVYTEIKDLHHKFIIDLIIDKIYVYGRTMISFIIARPDMCDITFTFPGDEILEYKKCDVYNTQEIIKTFFDHIITSILRCLNVSNGENVDVDVYCNCKLIKE